MGDLPELRPPDMGGSRRVDRRSGPLRHASFDELHATDRAFRRQAAWEMGVAVFLFACMIAAAAWTICGRSSSPAA